MSSKIKIFIPWTKKKQNKKTKKNKETKNKTKYSSHAIKYQNSPHTKENHKNLFDII